VFSNQGQCGIEDQCGRRLVGGGRGI